MRKTEKNNDALWSPDLERLKPILGNCWPDKWVRKVVGEYWQDGWYVNRNGPPEPVVNDLSDEDVKSDEELESERKTNSGTRQLGSTVDKEETNESRRRDGFRGLRGFSIWGTKNER
jgi:hypothetical protein